MSLWLQLRAWSASRNWEMNSKDGSNCAVCTSAKSSAIALWSAIPWSKLSSTLLSLCELVDYFLIDVIDVDVVDVLRFFFGVVSSSPCSDISKNYQEIVIRRLQHSDFEFSYFEKMTPIFGVIESNSRPNRLWELVQNWQPCRPRTEKP